MVELFQRPLYAIEYQKNLHQICQIALVTSMQCNHSTKYSAGCWNYQRLVKKSGDHPQFPRDNIACPHGTFFRTTTKIRYLKKQPKVCRRRSFTIAKVGHIGLFNACCTEQSQFFSLIVCGVIFFSGIFNFPQNYNRSFSLSVQQFF